MESIGCPTCPEGNNVLVHVEEKLREPLPRLNLAGQVHEDVKSFLTWALKLETQAAEKEEADVKAKDRRRESNHKICEAQKSAKQKAKPRKSRFSKMEA